MLDSEPLVFFIIANFYNISADTVFSYNTLPYTGDRIRMPPYNLWEEMWKT